MKNITFILLVFVLWTLRQTQAQNYSAYKIPKELLKNANAVVRYEQQIFNVLTKGKATAHYKYAITILNKNADFLADIDLPYSKLRKLDFVKGKVYNAEGSEIKKLKKTDISDESNFASYSIFADRRIKRASLSHHTYPYTVEVEFQYTDNNLMFYPVWNFLTGYHHSTEYSALKVIMPQGLELRYKELNLPKNCKLQKNIEGNNISYTWTAQNLPAIKYEPFLPSYTFPSVRTAPSEFKVEGYEGNMSSWKEFGKFQTKLNEGRNELAEETKNEVKKLVAGISSKEEQVKKIYEYMQSKTRYVSISLGIGGWQPFSAKEVDTKGYGDCKALSNYTKSLLDVVGIESYYTIINSGDDARPILKDFPSAYFNHIILSVPLPKDTIWLECTSQTEAFGYLGDFTGNRKALIVTPEGGKIVSTETYHKNHNQSKVQASIILENTGNAEIQAHNTYKALEEGERKWLAEKGKEAQKKWYYENIDIPNFEILSFEMTRNKKRVPVCTDKLKLKVNKLASKSGKRLFLKPNLFSKWSYIPTSIENRTQEVYLPAEYDFQEEDILTYQVPPQYYAEYLPKKIAFESEFGKYSASFEMQEEGKIVYKRHFSMNAGTYSKESYEKLITFLKKVAKSDMQKIVLVSGT